jgi:hypothetical protein
MNKLFLAFAVLSVSLAAAPADPAKKECPKGQCCKADKACDQKDCKADAKKDCAKGCEDPHAARKAKAAKKA